MEDLLHSSAELVYSTGPHCSCLVSSSPANLLSCSTASRTSPGTSRSPWRAFGRCSLTRVLPGPWWLLTHLPLSGWCQEAFSSKPTKALTESSVGPRRRSLWTSMALPRPWQWRRWNLRTISMIMSCTRPLPLELLPLTSALLCSYLDNRQDPGSCFIPPPSPLGGSTVVCPTLLTFFFLRTHCGIFLYFILSPTHNYIHAHTCLYLYIYVKF